jgi:hypothetical protein
MVLKLKKLISIKKKDQFKLVKYSSLALIICFSVGFGIFFSDVSVSCINTIQSIAIPDQYLNASMDLPNPYFKVALGIRNDGIYEMNDIEIKLEMDIQYYKSGEEEISSIHIFSDEIVISKIYGFQNCYEILEVAPSAFNIQNLEEFHNTNDFSKNHYYLLDIKIEGNYFSEIIPFLLEIDDMMIY